MNRLINHHIVLWQVGDDGSSGSRIWGLLRSVTSSSPQGESMSALKQEVAALEVITHHFMVTSICLSSCIFVYIEYLCIFNIKKTNFIALSVIQVTFSVAIVCELNIRLEVHLLLKKRRHRSGFFICPKCN